MTVPNKIYDININDVKIGVSEIHLYLKDELEKAQIGYRVDNNGNKIEEWIGDNYIVIGKDYCCGDPIIMDISDGKLPVYNMFHDDWNSLQKIADNFEQYIDILKKIDETNLSDEKEKNKLISIIKKIVSSDAEEYWNSIIQVAYEFFNDID